MGILEAIGNFLFGKNPDIFDETGRVRHHFTDEKWKDWNDRLKASPEYDWRNHIAQEKAHQVANPATPSDKKPN